MLHMSFMPLVSFQTKVDTLLNDVSTVLIRNGDEYFTVFVNCHHNVQCSSCRHKFTYGDVKTLQQQLDEGNPDLQEFHDVLNYDETRSKLVPSVISSDRIAFIVGQHSKLKESTSTSLLPDTTGLCMHLRQTMVSTQSS